MLFRMSRAAIFGLILLAQGEIARADDLAEFNAAVESAEAHNRVAIGYLRTGNSDLASVEIDRLRAAWRQVTERFAGRRPQAFAKNDDYVKAMTDIGLRLVTADMMFNSGRPDATRTALIGIRDNLSKLRKSAGVVVLADCVRDANSAMDALMVYDDRGIDLSKAAVYDGLAGRTMAYENLLDRCDGIANETVRRAPDFRRLIDGAKASLALIPKAISDRDNALLHRVLIELRAFDNLLAFRYG